jgi:hypothetical protein
MKADMLFQLDRFEKRGQKLSRKLTLDSSYEDIKAELERVKREKELAGSICLQRMILKTCVGGIEFLNSTFDPFGVRLDGWSDNVNNNMSSYDEIFEELHDKYKGRAKFAPEIKLMFMLGGSAVNFHLTNTLMQAAGMPNAAQVFRQNPDLARQFADAAATKPPQGAPKMRGPSALGDALKGLEDTTTPPPPKVVVDVQPEPSEAGSIRKQKTGGNKTRKTLNV